MYMNMSTIAEGFAKWIETIMILTSRKAMHNDTMCFKKMQSRKNCLMTSKDNCVTTDAPYCNIFAILAHCAAM